MHIDYKAMSLFLGVVVATAGIVAGSQNIHSNSQLSAVYTPQGTFNFFAIPRLPLFYLTAPGFSIIPLEKLPTYQIKKLPENNQQLVTDRVSHTSTTTNTTNPLSNALNSFKPIITKVEDASVNIFCSQRIGNQRKMITGSGVLIHKDGTVLTNAHVAQYPLVADTNKNVVCMARTGANVENTYSVRTVFISPEWSTKNAPYINTGGTTQTGEHDYALLKITGDLGNLSTPIPLTVNAESKGSLLQLVSYPASTLAQSGKIQRQKDSPSLLTYYSLGYTDQDAFTTSETKLAQHGSSGALVANQYNQLVGIVSIITDSPTSSLKRINGITVLHVNQSISKYISDGLLKASNSGSESLSSYFDTNYRSNLTSLFNKYLTQ